MITPIYDVIIIGAGISGLYAAYKIKKNQPQTRTLIIEKESTIGGRAGTLKFHNTPIAIGAGVGREKDKRLQTLINDLSIKHHEFQTHTHYTSGLQASSLILQKQFLYLRREFEKPIINKRFKNTTFKEYAIKMLGEQQYNLFSQSAGYTDYENADIEDVLYDYHFQDNIVSWTAISLHWSDLINALVKVIGKKNIILDEEVSRLTKRDKSYPMCYDITTQTNQYKARNIILATTVDTVQRLLPEKDNLYKQIHGQPFLRMYGKFTKASARTMAQYVPTQTVVQGLIHKIIPMNPENGVFMIVYTDNEAANKLKRYSKNTPRNREILCRYLEDCLAIPKNTLNMTDMCDFYWKIGTHYYAPLNNEYSNRVEFIREAQRPYPNVYVVGEMISRNQGWVEGALESVDRVITTNVKFMK